LSCNNFPQASLRKTPSLNLQKIFMRTSIFELLLPCQTFREINSPGLFSQAQS